MSLVGSWYIIGLPGIGNCQRLKWWMEHRIPAWSFWRDCRHMPAFANVIPLYLDNTVETTRYTTVDVAK